MSTLAPIVPVVSLTPRCEVKVTALPAWSRNSMIGLSADSVAWIDADDGADSPSPALREHEVDIEEIDGIADENQREEEHPHLRVRELQPRLP